MLRLQQSFTKAVARTRAESCLIDGQLLRKLQHAREPVEGGRAIRRRSACGVCHDLPRAGLPEEDSIRDKKMIDE